MIKQKLYSVDLEVIFLNVSSVTTLVYTFVQENISVFGVFLLLASMAALNLAKAYGVYKKAKNEKNEKEDENDTTETI